MSEKNLKGFKLYKNDLGRFFDLLKEEGELIAPVQTEKWLRMQSVSNVDEVSFTGISWYSSKKFVFPQKQVLFEYDNNEIISKKSEYRKRVLFGLRLCDLNSFLINDKLFLEQNLTEESYANNRRNLFLVGLWCDKPQDSYCFCSSMELKHYYDLCLFDRGDYFHVKVGSENGNRVLSRLNLDEDSEYWKESPECHNHLVSKDIERFFHRDDVWQKGTDKCLSCSDCTSLCPTCLCFDAFDEVNLDMKSGERIVQWDSCMFRDFTLVAGGHVFRNNRLNRFKHRIYHKLVYFPKKFNMFMCTGCGRCIRGCPTKIHWASMINGLFLEEAKNNNRGD